MHRGTLAAAAIAASLAASPAPSHAAAPRVLATGDSLITQVDFALGARLAGRAEVSRDAQVATGLSKPWLLNWPRYARQQARSFRPGIVVIFMGANDGFPMRGRRCCGKHWRREYARRAGRVADAYRRDGVREVYWLRVPQARAKPHRRFHPAVNEGLRLAAMRRAHMRTIALDQVFTPGGRYRGTMRYGDRNVRVRHKDGIHLSAAGAEIAAEVVERRLRRDGVLN